MRRPLVLCAVLLLAAGLAFAATSPPRAAVIGTWRGTSVCTDRVAAPACKDEVVVYRFTPSGRDSVLLKAYKIVDGEEAFMGDLVFGWVAKPGAWVGEFVSPRSRSRWTFVVADTVLTGKCELLPGARQVRRVRVVRDPAR